MPRISTNSLEYYNGCEISVKGPLSRVIIQIVGILFEVHNELGRFCREKQYSELISNKLSENKINHKREFEISDTGNVVDFLIENKIILELKSKRIILKKDYYQIQRYLQVTNLKLGILVNFRSEYLNPKRIVKKDN